MSESLPINQIICGDALTMLKEIPSGAVNCCISSPPYWALRDYGIEGQLGLEPTLEEYIDKLCTIYDEVKRVLRSDGTCFVNMGDTYGGSGGKGKTPEESIKNAERAIRKGYNVGGWSKDGQGINNRNVIDTRNMGIPIKSLCLIPQRFAIEMVNRGWILRNVLIWHKPNPMPSSAKDRFTVDFEYVYFFVKNNDILWHFRPDGKVSNKQPDYKNGIEGLDYEWGIRKGKAAKLSLWQGFKYYFEQQFEPYLTESNAERPRMGQGQNTQYSQKRRDVKPIGIIGEHDNRGQTLGPLPNNPLGRNKRCVWLDESEKGTVWTIPTEPRSEAHFATFPQKLVEPMILAGCPRYVCTECGKAREKIIDKGSLVPDGLSQKSCSEKWLNDDNRDVSDKGWNLESNFAPNMQYEKTFKGYTDCGCGAEYRPGVVMDMFCGSGTVCRVAAQNQRDYIGIDLNPEYIEDIAKPFVNEVETGVGRKEIGQQALFEPEQVEAANAN